MYNISMMFKESSQFKLRVRYVQYHHVFFKVSLQCEVFTTQVASSLCTTPTCFLKSLFSSKSLPHKQYVQDPSCDSKGSRSRSVEQRALLTRSHIITIQNNLVMCLARHIFPLLSHSLVVGSLSSFNTHSKIYYTVVDSCGK